MAAALKALVATATIILMIQLATAAKNFTVGSPGGSWNLATNFATWTKANTFTVGDNLIFSYTAGQHDVVEVTKANHDSCSISGAIKTYTTGNDVIPLPAAATRYFICGIPGHCTSGMKLTVNVVAAPVLAPPPKSTTPAPTPSSHSAPAPSPAVTPPPSGSAPAPASPVVTPPPSGSTPAPASPAVTPPPSGSTPGPSGNSTPPPSTSTPSGANNLQAKAAVGFGVGMLMFMLAL